MPNSIIEWIPYCNLKDVKYLTRGGFSEIFTAEWINGYYDEWDSKKQRLKRFEMMHDEAQSVVLKKLVNVESANQNWLEEVCNLSVLFKYV